MSLNIAHLALVHVAATLALTGLVWTVQLAIYPQFSAVGRGEFPDYHRRYVRGITGVVAPLSALEILTAAALFWQGVRGPLFLGSLVLIAMITAVTFIVEVPLHRKLRAGFEAGLHRLLVFANWARTLGWTARAVMVSVWLYSLSGW